MPTALKGADLVVYSVLKSLGIEVDVLPVLKTEQDEQDDYWGTPEEMISYLKEGKEFEPEYSQVPTELPMDLGVDEYWKALSLSRQVRGLKEISRFAKTAQIPIENEKFWQHRGKYVAFERTPYTTTNSGQEMATSEVSDQRKVPPAFLGVGTMLNYTLNPDCQRSVASAIPGRYHMAHEAYTRANGFDIHRLWQRGVHWNDVLLRCDPGCHPSVREAPANGLSIRIVRLEYQGRFRMGGHYFRRNISR